MREQSVALEYQTELALVDRNLCHVLTVQCEGAALRVDKAGNHAQRCGFTASARSEKGNELTFLDLKI